jgi:hypothetical protein
LGHQWWGWYRWISDKYQRPLSLIYPEIASHNHFVLNRQGRVLNQTAPAIILRQPSSEIDHLALLAFINSSIACFLMKQVAHQKQLTGGDGVRVESRAKVPYQYSGSQLLNLSLPPAWQTGHMRQRLEALGRRMDSTVSDLVVLSAAHALSKALMDKRPVREVWESYCDRREILKSKLVLLQEQIDFTAYAAFGLIGNELVGEDADGCTDDLRPGNRPFEILRGASEEGFPVPNEIPVHWTKILRQLWEKRIQAIRQSKELQLVEDAHYKRRWIGRQGTFNHQAGVNDLAPTLRDWLLVRLENPLYWSTTELTSCAHLADKVGRDAGFMEVAALYRNRPDFDLTELVVELVESESVPFLPVLRYKESGLRKRAIWEHVWDLQRREDAIEAEVRGQRAAARGEAQIQKEIKCRQKQEVGDIPVPPKFDTKDFVSTTCWRLRGKLDVPKERFIAYPRCNRDADRTPVIGWAGWDHLQQAQAVAGYYERMRTNEGWTDDRLLPLLAGVLELLPWLLQWHNAIDPQYGMGLGDFFRSFVEEEARRMGKTLDEVRAWQPPAKPGRKKKGA